MNPARIEVQEIEDDVSNVGSRQDKQVVRHYEQDQIERQIRPHSSRRRTVLVDMR
jgi:hypothetical protein